MVTRRSILAALLAGKAARGQSARPPVTALTKGPKFHRFACYDKLQVDPPSRYVLSHQVDFEHRPLVLSAGSQNCFGSAAWTRTGIFSRAEVSKTASKRASSTGMRWPLESLMSTPKFLNSFNPAALLRGRNRRRL